MTRTQGLGVVLTCVLLLAWLTGSSRVAVPRAASATGQPGALMNPDPAIQSMPRQAVRLREHFSSVAPLAPSRRNPFLFGGAPSASRRSGRAAPTLAASVQAKSPQRPAVALLGIAEDSSEQGMVRKAIVSANGELFIVGEGERVLGRYEVVKIGLDAVELRDGADTFTLALK